MYCLKSLPPKPVEAACAKSLSDLGYYIDMGNQVAKLSTDRNKKLTANDPATYQHWGQVYKKRDDDAHIEALHEALRAEVMDQLKSVGIKQVYLTGANGRALSDIKPDGPHIPILVSKKVEEKRSVILIIGEHTQDPAIFSWYRTLNKEGIDGGTAVGIVKLLAEKHKHLIKRIADIETAQRVAVEKKKAANIDVDEDSTFYAIDGGSDISLAEAIIEEPKARPEMPGIIVLNPGQRTYSHKHNKTYTQESWLARASNEHQAHSFCINRRENLLPGHKEPHSHVTTFCESFLPRLVHYDCKIFVIAIRDGAEHVLLTMDKQLSHYNYSFLHDRIASIALLGPTNFTSHIESDGLKKMLLDHGHAWVLGDGEKGSILQIPAGHRKLREEKAKSSNTGAAATQPILVPFKMRNGKMLASAHHAVNKAPNSPDIDHQNGTEDAEIHCITMSAGDEVGHVDSILPVVMEDVLNTFYEAGIWSAAE